MSKRYRVIRTSPPPGIPGARVIAYFALDAAWRAAEQYARFDKAAVRIHDTETDRVIASFDFDGTDLVMETP